MNISIIIPFYNNEGSIPELFSRIKNMSENDIFKGHSFELVLVDDGSIDNTFKYLEAEFSQLESIKGKIVKLTRNFGSYNSFLAGMYHASGDCCVHLHADLQDPPELIPQLFENYLKGFKLVIANREDREDPSIFSKVYHYLVQKYAIKQTPPGGFDLMLFDKRIKDEIVKISEKNTNNVYLINWLGYPYVSIPYKRVKRKFGKSQWGFTNKIKLFVDTFFSFSNLPIKLIRYNLLFSFLFLIAMIIQTLLPMVALAQSNLIFAVSIALFILNLNFVIVAEFLTRIHETARRRPSFVVEDVLER
jgi:dolichol-phosphate mannosyltransferase